MNVKDRFERIAALALLVTLGVGALCNHGTSRLLFAAVILGVLLRGLVSICAGVLSRLFTAATAAGVSLALLAAAMPAEAQGGGPPETMPTPAPTPDWGASIAVSSVIPAQPGDPEKLGIIPVAICVGIGVGIIGWIGVKILDACNKVNEHNVTNNQQQEFQAQAEPTSPTSPVPPPPPPPTSPTSPGGPGTVAQCPCSAVAPAAGAPLPLVFEHSHDGETWTPLSRGFSIGSTLDSPATGFWRIRALPVRITIDYGTPTVHAPPGILEWSTDLKSWETVATHTVDTDLPAQAGRFYRVRL